MCSDSDITSAIQVYKMRITSTWVFPVYIIINRMKNATWLVLLLFYLMCIFYWPQRIKFIYRWHAVFHNDKKTLF